MSKKGGFWDNPFGGMFDFNGDGKEDWGEQWFGLKILEECTKDDADDDFSFDDDLDFDFSSDKDYSWRLTCEDGFEFGINPEDYETEEEYEEALEEAKYAWREICEDGFEFGIDPEDYETEEEYIEALEEARNSDVEIKVSASFECPALDKIDVIKESDYPNKRRYNAAHILANEVWCFGDEKERCKFIVEKAASVIAANYLAHDVGFLYTQAIRDNFKLPVFLPAEDETRKYEFSEIICKIAGKDIPLSFEVWSWALEQFLPYAKYDDYAVADLTSNVIAKLYNFPDEYGIELVHYMDENLSFRQKIAEKSTEAIHDYAGLIVIAIKEEIFDTATVLFEVRLKQADGQWKEINSLTESTIWWCKNYEELESMEFFRDSLLPLVKAVENGIVQNKIKRWETEIAEYIDQVERQSDKYAYSRRYAWRKTVPDGEQYGLNPLFYDTEQKYLDALNDSKYAWRRWYKDCDTLGLNVNDFETQEEYIKAYSKAYNALLNEKRQKERQRRKDEYFKSADVLDDKNIYTICGVAFPHASHPYHYKTDDSTIKIGDTVCVPVGTQETEGTVVSVGQYTRRAAPYPIERIKQIIRKK